MNEAIIESIAVMTPEGNRLLLPDPEQHRMHNYAAVKKVLVSAGGKYSKNGFTFPEDARGIQARLTGGEVMNDKKKFQLFKTPPHIAKRMVHLAGLKYGDYILEPSAGSGNIIHEIEGQHMHRTTAIDLDEKRVAELATLNSELTVIHDDFLNYDPIISYDKIIMNPPFTKMQDIKHIKHAISLLHPEGMVVAICANGPRQQIHLEHLSVHWEELPAGSFKSEGTQVNTVLAIFPAE